MELVCIYECLCDRTRLRILNLLGEGPLCVCHLQEILQEPQVKVSKHLSYLKDHGLVEVTREANWRIYRLATKPTQALAANLACLQDCVREDEGFMRDTRQLKMLQATLEQGNTAACCPKAAKAKPLASASRPARV